MWKTIVEPKSSIRFRLDSVLNLQEIMVWIDEAKTLCIEVMLAKLSPLILYTARRPQQVKSCMTL
jgi:hypothetical protein